MKLIRILGIICLVVLLTGVVSADGWKGHTKNKNVYECQIVLTNKYIDTRQPSSIYRIDFHNLDNTGFGSSFPVT